MNYADPSGLGGENEAVVDRRSSSTPITPAATKYVEVTATRPEVRCASATPAIAETDAQPTVTPERTPVIEVGPIEKIEYVIDDMKLLPPPPSGQEHQAAANTRLANAVATTDAIRTGAIVVWAAPFVAEAVIASAPK